MVSFRASLTCGGLLIHPVLDWLENVSSNFATSMLQAPREMAVRVSAGHMVAPLRRAPEIAYSFGLCEEHYTCSWRDQFGRTFAMWWLALQVLSRWPLQKSFAVQPS